MLVNGSDCSIVIKTSDCEMDIPYSDETLREAVSFLQEEASIEGGGVCRGIRKSGGTTGCVITPLTIGTAPLLLYLAMGTAGKAAFVSETRNLYRQELNLLPMEDTEHFDLIQDRGNERRLYEGCRVQGFELRVMRNEAIKLKLDICGDWPPREYPYTDTPQGQVSAVHGTALKPFPVIGRERFNGDSVAYEINGKEYTNIYGITLVSKKEGSPPNGGGTKTELWIKRALEHGGDIPEIIEKLVITAQLLQDKYECRFYGTFRITLKRLVLVSDETEVNASGAVICPLRYYAAGGVTTEIFTSSDEAIP